MSTASGGMDNRKPLWRYVTKHEAVGNGGGGVLWECNFCGLKRKLHTQEL